MSFRAEVRANKKSGLFVVVELLLSFIGSGSRFSSVLGYERIQTVFKTLILNARTTHSSSIIP